MITGTVNADFEPIISLSIRRADGEVFTQEAIVDTGFNGWLSLPPDLIAELNLRWKRRGRAILGDGSECVFNVYEAVVFWDGELRTHNAICWRSIIMDRMSSKLPKYELPKEGN